MSTSASNGGRKESDFLRAARDALVGQRMTSVVEALRQLICWAEEHEREATEENVRKLQLQTDDILLVRVASDRAVMELTEQFREWVPAGVKVLVVGPSISVDVIGPAHAPEETP